MPTQLTPHFTLEELTASETARRIGIDNAPSAEHLANLHRLAAALEVARDIIGAPLVIHSGFRSKTLNRAVGGAPSSDHLEGLAADFVPRSARKVTEEFNELEMAMKLGLLNADQLIVYPKRGHIHLGIGPRMRRSSWIDWG